MSNPFILIARIRVKDGKINDYLKIANEVDNLVKNSEPDMLIHTFDQDPHDKNEFTWTEVYRNSRAMIKHINNPPVKSYVLKHEELAEKFEIEVYGNLTQETIEAINNLNVPFKHFKTTSVGYFREDIFSNNEHEEKLDRINDQFSEEVTLENIK